MLEDYKRHNTKQAEMVLEFLGRMARVRPHGGARSHLLTGSGAGMPLRFRRKMVQEVVAVGCGREAPPAGQLRLSGEDMKTLFFTACGDGKTKQVCSCSGGSGTFIEKTARKPGSRRSACRHEPPGLRCNH